MDGEAWWATVHGVLKSQTQLSDFTFTFHFHALAQMVKRLSTMWETRVQSLGREDPLEKEMATHSSVLPRKGHGQGSLVSYSIGSQSWI